MVERRSLALALCDTILPFDVVGCSDECIEMVNAAPRRYHRETLILISPEHPTNKFKEL